MSAKTKPDLRLSVDITDKRFHARVVYLVDPEPTPTNPNDSGVRNPSAHLYDNPLAGFANLAVTALRDPTSETADGEWFGMELEYRDVYSVDAEQAQIMARTLRRLNTKLTKLNETFGRADDLATFCGRVTHALGSTAPYAFGRRFDSLQMNGKFYRWVDVDGLRSWLNKPE
jgi:hypothetical protein